MKRSEICTKLENSQNTPDDKRLIKNKIKSKKEDKTKSKKEYHNRMHIMVEEKNMKKTKKSKNTFVTQKSLSSTFHSKESYKVVNPFKSKMSFKSNDKKRTKVLKHLKSNPTVTNPTVTNLKPSLENFLNSVHNF